MWLGNLQYRGGDCGGLRRKFNLILRFKKCLKSKFYSKRQMGLLKIINVILGHYCSSTVQDLLTMYIGYFVKYICIPLTK